MLAKDFHEACKDHDITLTVFTTNYNKIIGFLCPLKYMVRKGCHPLPADKPSLILFFDDQKMRKCTPKDRIIELDFSSDCLI